MLPFLPTLAAAIEPLGLPGTRVVVGVSGGADSVALLCGLRALSPPSSIELHAAHLNHGLRPGSAEEDAEWTRALCRRLDVPIVVDQIDVRHRALAEGWNIEEAARICRYEFFERTARAVGSTRVAVAHTADDRVETVLHHLFRGTGLAGLRGIKVFRALADGITLVRPLLGIRRKAIENWLAEIGQDYRTDATNADESRTRNRIRHTVLPWLEKEFGPQVRESLLRLSEQADELQSTFEAAADLLLESILADDSPDICRLDVAGLNGQPRHLIRETFVALWKRKRWQRQRMGFEDWDRLYRLVKDGGGRLVLPGSIEASRRGTLIVLRKTDRE